MNKLAIDIPTNIILNLLSFPFDKICIRIKEKIPPIIANVGLKRIKLGKNKVIISAKKDAPELMPKIAGSANGFLNAHYNSTPDIENAAPLSSEIKILGNLKSNIVSTL